VEDNPANAALMAEVVALRPAYRLHVCRTLADARTQLRTLRPRLVLADLHLPDGNGIELLAWMRADEALAGVPLVVVSADATRQQREAALAAGAQAYLTKPLHIDEALRCIDALVNGSAG
jgi:DNA-binding response OmpR family regulator